MPYTCFLHPKRGTEFKLLTDKCPTCGRSFSFPLDIPPKKVADTTILSSLGRGFYGATYVAESGPFNNKCVVKVIPKDIYKCSNKDFNAECILHNELSKGTEHIVKINSMGEASVEFDGNIIDCYYSILEYADGDTLEKILIEDKALPGATIAQIAIDLYQLLQELNNQKLYHNDLHAGNLILERLPDRSRRKVAVDDNVRLRAVDLGSVSPDNASNPDQERRGDIRWAASHIKKLTSKLLKDPDVANAKDYRLASLLDEHCYLLDHISENSRIPSFEELARQVHESVVEPVEAPWRQKVKLRQFSECYNAQTLHSWHVPSLIVDPKNQWLDRVLKKGPLIISGMRGCGKTMVLRYADFHARACLGGLSESALITIERLRTDGFVGFYASAMRLLGSYTNAFGKLLVVYSRTVIQALEHLSDIDPSQVSPNSNQYIAEAISRDLTNTEHLSNAGSLRSLDRMLLIIQTSLDNGEEKHVIHSSPAQVFERLSDAIRKCSLIWKNHYINFLLDDVSTRYLSDNDVRKIVSELLFSSESCAFKFTTEAQTLELVLLAPGQNSPAWAGRDYEVFDLGFEVNQKFDTKSTGIEFLENILKQRAQHYARHPIYPPKSILGDKSLEAIAEHIASTSATSKEKKEIYHGISTLTGVSVGDIGDVISLYDEMLRRSDDGVIPIPAQVQSECFQNYCSRKIYDLNRRQTDLRDFALTFAEASHELLDLSYKERQNDPSARLRQYTKIYIMITSGDKASQFKKIRNLIDAGVFIYEGGTETPRTKTRDSDPIGQFILSYRKLFGLSNFIPLADRDRFELSGQTLEKWLNSAGSRKEALLEKLTSGKRSKKRSKDSSGISKTKKIKSKKNLPTQQQLMLLNQLAPTKTNQSEEPSPKSDYQSLDQSIPNFKKITKPSKGTNFDCLVLGLGFEERTLASLESYASDLTFRKVICLEYREPGYSKQILHSLKKCTKNITTIKAGSWASLSKNILGNSIAVDVTGLSTPAIFFSIRKALGVHAKTWIAHSTAKKHYPDNRDIQKILSADTGNDVYALLESMSKVLIGEEKPYSLISLLPTAIDEMRERVLCAFASAKHERLLTLLDQRDYDKVQIAVPSSQSPRSMLAQIAADVAAKSKEGSVVQKIQSNCLEGPVQWLIKSYKELFLSEGCNLEIGLTGSKLEAVAAAALCNYMKIAACWYVQPRRFDPKKFTIGYKTTDWFCIDPTTQLPV